MVGPEVGHRVRIVAADVGHLAVDPPVQRPRGAVDNDPRRRLGRETICQRRPFPQRLAPRLETQGPRITLVALQADVPRVLPVMCIGFVDAHDVPGAIMHIPELLLARGGHDVVLVALLEARVRPHPHVHVHLGAELRRDVNRGARKEPVQHAELRVDRVPAFAVDPHNIVRHRLERLFQLRHQQRHLARKVVPVHLDLFQRLAVEPKTRRSTRILAWGAAQVDVELLALLVGRDVVDEGAGILVGDLRLHPLPGHQGNGDLRAFPFRPTPEPDVGLAAVPGLEPPRPDAVPDHPARVPRAVGPVDEARRNRLSIQQDRPVDPHRNIAVVPHHNTHPAEVGVLLVQSLHRFEDQADLLLVMAAFHGLGVRRALGVGHVVRAEHFDRPAGGHRRFLRPRDVTRPGNHHALDQHRVPVAPRDPQFVHRIGRRARRLHVERAPRRRPLRRVQRGDLLPVPEDPQVAAGVRTAVHRNPRHQRPRCPGRLHERPQRQRPLLHVLVDVRAMHREAVGFVGNQHGIVVPRHQPPVGIFVVVRRRILAVRGIERDAAPSRIASQLPPACTQRGLGIRRLHLVAQLDPHVELAEKARRGRL